MNGQATLRIQPSTAFFNVFMPADWRNKKNNSWTGWRLIEKKSSLDSAYL